MNKPNDQKNHQTAQQGFMPTKPFDSFFKAALQHKAVAKEFFIQELPEKLSQQLDYSTLTPLNTSYISEELQNTFSDVCFECHYEKEFLHKQGVNKPTHAKIIVLVEHQSSPDKLMPFRIFHYLINALHKEILKHSEGAFSEGLPAIYPLIYYHGEQTVYPYPLSFASCFFDPANIMNEVFTKDIPLININDYSDEEILKSRIKFYFCRWKYQEFR